MVVPHRCQGRAGHLLDVTPGGRPASGRASAGGAPVHPPPDRAGTTTSGLEWPVPRSWSAGHAVRVHRSPVQAPTVLTGLAQRAIEAPSRWLLAFSDGNDDVWEPFLTDDDPAVDPIPT